MTNKELELIAQLTEVAMTVAELRAENKTLKDVNEKLMQALRIHDVVGRSEKLKAFADYAQKRMWEDGDKDLSEFVGEFLRL